MKGSTSSKVWRNKNLPQSDVTAQWMCLRLPSCSSRFEYQAQHLHITFFNLNLNCIVKKRKIIKKGHGLAHILKTINWRSNLVLLDDMWRTWNNILIEPNIYVKKMIAILIIWWKQSGEIYFISFAYDATSVTRLGHFLDFGQLFKAFGNNQFAQISQILRQFL